MLIDCDVHDYKLIVAKVFEKYPDVKVKLSYKFKPLILEEPKCYCIDCESGIYRREMDSGKFDRVYNSSIMLTKDNYINNLDNIENKAMFIPYSERGIQEYICCYKHGIVKYIHDNISPTKVEIIRENS